MKSIIRIFSAMLITALSSVALAEVVVVVGAQSPVGNLEEKLVADIFLGKRTSFPDGSTATPIDQTEGNDDREEFHSAVTKKSGSRLKSYWSKMVFTGKGQAPQEASNAAEVRKLLSENPNMIGYINKDHVDSSVKVVMSL